MDPRMKAVLDSIPDSPTRSKLDPYQELIRGLRQKRKTFRQIAQILHTNFNVQIGHTAIYKFVKARSKRVLWPPIAFVSLRQLTG